MDTFNIDGHRATNTPLFTPEEHLEMCRVKARLWEIRNKAQPYPLYTAGEEAPLPVVSNYEVLGRIKKVVGLANYAKQKVQEHISYTQKKKKGKYD